MQPLKIGACLRAEEIAAHRNWLFEADRDIEIQGFTSLAALTTERDDRVAATRAALDGHRGRLGMHGPFEGLDMDNKDPEVQPIITRRFMAALEAAEAIGAQQMVLHSPYTRWYRNNLHNKPGYAANVLERVHRIMAPVVARAEETGVTLVIENIFDASPEVRREMVESFDSDALALSIDTGHAHLARHMSGAPPVDYFVRDAGALLRHVHVQDLDGHADRHWAPGEGTIEWDAVFRALADCVGDPHLVLELRNKADIPKGFAYLEQLGLVA